MRHETANPETVKPDEGPPTEEIVRVLAYLFFEGRGCEHGHDLEDWFRAEAEILGKKPGAAERDHAEAVSRAA